MPASSASSSSTDETGDSIPNDMGAPSSSTPPGLPAAANLSEALAALAAATAANDPAAIIAMANRITALTATGLTDGAAATGGNTSHPGNAGGGAGSEPASTSPLPVSSPAPALAAAPPQRAPRPATSTPSAPRWARKVPSAL